MPDEKKSDEKKAPAALKVESAEERLVRQQRDNIKTSGTFVIAPGQKHYRLGKLYVEGELITIADEVPSRAFAVWDPEAGRRPVAPPPAPKTVNDLNL